MTDNYGTRAEADTYHAARGNAAWASADEATRDVALLIASEWIDGKYRASFPGWKTGLRAQVREWPRTGAFDIERHDIATDEIPVEVENATYEAALRHITTPGSLLTDYTMGQRISSVTVVGAVAVQYEGISGAMDLQLSIPGVDRILAPILTGSPSSGLVGGFIRG
jgi:hypothetical protein